MATFNQLGGIAFAILCVLPIFANAIALESYNVDPKSVTVSGLSSGGAFVQQFHIAYSEDVHGAGVFAGLPFGCAKGGLTSATLCMSSPGTVVVNNLIAEINKLETAGTIAKTSNLSGDKVFVFHGTKDTTVNPTAGHKLEEIYDHFGADIETEYSIGAVHGFPTDFYGASCGFSSAGTQYINNCNYHGAFIMLQHLYDGTLTAPTGRTPLAGTVTEYEQKEFISALTAATISMDAHGFVYVPSGCADRTKKCKFHISFHGCQQSKSTVQNIYATKTGFLEVAELNDIIVLFPQATANILAGNPNACWDWWGYLNANFLTQNGAQMKAVHNMLNRVVNCDGGPCYEDATDAPTAPTATTTSTPGTGSTPPPSGECKDNEVTFRPFPGSCEYYILCACGAEVLLHCAPGLYFDPTLKSCNFIQLVDCVPS